MYSLALDESGTHAGSLALLVAGIAVHESDVRRLEDAVHDVLARHLQPLGLDPYDFEAHAAELKTPSRAKARTAKRGARAESIWLQVPAATRLQVLNDVYAAIGAFKAGSDEFPLRVFAATVDRGNKTQPKTERIAYDYVLHQFDEMLTEVSAKSGVKQRGLVLHDRRDGYDRVLQDQVARRQRSAGALAGIVHVPVFTDSRTSRMVQAADFVAYAIWRHYSAGETDHADMLWPMAGQGPNGELAGAVHRCPEFNARTCKCPPCASRY